MWKNATSAQMLEVSPLGVERVPPSRKGCVVNAQMTKVRNKWIRPCSPPNWMDYIVAASFLERHPKISNKKKKNAIIQIFSYVIICRHSQSFLMCSTCVCLSVCLSSFLVYIYIIFLAVPFQSSWNDHDIVTKKKLKKRIFFLPLWCRNMYCLILVILRHQHTW